MARVDGSGDAVQPPSDQVDLESLRHEEQLMHSVLEQYRDKIDTSEDGRITFKEWNAWKQNGGELAIQQAAKTLFPDNAGTAQDHAQTLIGQGRREFKAAMDDINQAALDGNQQSLDERQGTLDGEQAGLDDRWQDEGAEGNAELAPHQGVKDQWQEDQDQAQGAQDSVQGQMDKDVWGQGDRGGADSAELRRKSDAITAQATGEEAGRTTALEAGVDNAAHQAEDADGYYSAKDAAASTKEGEFGDYNTRVGQLMADLKSGDASKSDAAQAELNAMGFKFNGKAWVARTEDYEENAASWKETVGRDAAAPGAGPADGWYSAADVMSDSKNPDPGTPDARYEDSITQAFRQLSYPSLTAQDRAEVENTLKELGFVKQDNHDGTKSTDWVAPSGDYDANVAKWDATMDFRDMEKKNPKPDGFMNLQEAKSLGLTQEQFDAIASKAGRSSDFNGAPLISLDAYVAFRLSGAIGDPSRRS